jgi:hypothetical protein
MTDVLAVYLNLRRIVRFIFSDSKVGFRRREYPSITLDFSNFANLWRTVLSVILYPKFWRYLVISYEDAREFFPSWTSRILSISSTTKKIWRILLLLCIAKYCQLGNSTMKKYILLISLCRRIS